ncbi:MAG: YecA family protein [Bacillota bacterium]
MGRIGRNDPCPCGSGKKYKKCCINKADLNIERNRHWFKEDIEELSTDAIITRLKYYGVEFNKQDFIEGIRKYHSAEAISEHWFKIYNINVKNYDKYFLWLAAWVLCERYSEENIMCDEQLDENIIQGYDLVEYNRDVEACNIWLKVWDYLKFRFGENGYQDIDKASEDFKGNVYLSSWIDDMEMYLHNAGLKNKVYFKKRIKFCQDILKLLPNSKESIIRDIKRAEASSYFYLGKINKGDEKFLEIVNEYPNWVWGYIGWGDIYGISRVVPDPEKAEKIYRMAFDVELEDKEDSLDYLHERLLNLD